MSNDKVPLMTFIGAIIGSWIFWGSLIVGNSCTRNHLTVEEEILLREKWNLENPEFKEICINGNLFVLHKDNLTQVNGETCTPYKKVK